MQRRVYRACHPPVPSYASGIPSILINPFLDFYNYSNRSLKIFIYLKFEILAEWVYYEVLVERK